MTIPTWNEEVCLESSLMTLHAFCREQFVGDEWSIEVADNSSTDRTCSIVEELISRLDHLTLRRRAERGKGAAIRDSWSAHRGEVEAFAFMDADLAADVRALPALLAPVLTGHVDLVCGSRLVAGARVKRAWTRRVLSQGYRVWQKWWLHLPVEDAQCGFKAVSSRVVREILPHLKEDGWLFDSELIAHVARRDWFIRELPIEWMDRRNLRRRSALSVWRDGWEFIFGVIKVIHRLRS